MSSPPAQNGRYEGPNMLALPSSHHADDPLVAGTHDRRFHFPRQHECRSEERLSCHGPRIAPPQETLPPDHRPPRPPESGFIECVGDRRPGGGPAGPERSLEHRDDAHVSGQGSPQCTKTSNASKVCRAPGSNDGRNAGGHAPTGPRATFDHINRILRGTHRSAHPSARPGSAEEWSTPAHLKHFPRSDWARLDALIHEAWGHCNEKMALWLWLKTSVLEPERIAALPLPQHLEEAELTPDDIQRMLEHKYISEYTGDTAKIVSTVKVFSVMEKDGTRRRIIFHPAMINLFIADAGFIDSLVQLPTVDDQVSVCATFEGGLCADGTAFYTQFPALEVDSPNFVFSFNGVLYRNTSICTGQRQCVALAQLVLAALVEITKRTHPAVHYTPYIDNIRFCGTHAEAHAAWRIFRLRAEEACLQFELQSDWALSYTFLGIHYQHRSTFLSCSSFADSQRIINPEITIGEKAATKIALWKKRITGVEADWLQWTMQEAVSLFGLLVWTSRVLDINSGPYYYYLKFLRRRGEAMLTDDANLWPSLLPVLRLWLDTIAAKKRFMGTVRHGAETAYVYSDASLKGHGCVVYFRNSIFISAGKFSLEERIHILEARAWIAAVDFVYKVLTPDIALNCHCVFYIDNTSVIGAHNRGYSKLFLLNSIVARLRSRLSTLLGSFEVEYVKSALNHADFPSRANEHYEMLYMLHPQSDDNLNFIDECVQHFQ